MNDLNPFKYSLSELKAAIIAGIYLVFAILMLHYAVPIGLESACVALVGPAFALIQVFTTTEHSPMDLQKALEALRGAAITLIGFYVAVPDSTNEQLTVVIVGIVAAIGIAWSRRGVVSRT